MTPFPSSDGGNNTSWRKPKIDRSVLILTGIGVVVVLLAVRQGGLGLEDLLLFLVVVPSIILHEVSHGALAKVYGDDTAQRAGRLTLNPLRHVDPWGTFIVPAILVMSHLPPFGWAKPVPVNTTHMSRNKQMLVGLVGPATNIVIAIFAAALIHVLAPSTYEDVTSTPVTLVLQLGVANVVLAAFNLIPIPPLDGSSVVERFLPKRYEQAYYTFRKYSIALLFLLMLFFSPQLGRIFDPAIDLWTHLLPSNLQN